MPQQEPKSNLLAYLSLIATLFGALATLLAAGRIPSLRQHFPAESLASPETASAETQRKRPLEDNFERAQPSLLTHPILITDVLSTNEKNSEAVATVALIVKVREGERTAGYDKMIEGVLPSGKVLDARRFNDRAATRYFFRTMANDANSFFSAVGFLNFAGAVVLAEEESADSGLGNSTYLSVKVALRVRVIDVRTGRVSLLKEMEAVGAGFTPKQALDDARAKIHFSKSEFEEALKS